MSAMVLRGYVMVASVKQNNSEYSGSLAFSPIIFFQVTRGQLLDSGVLKIMCGL